MFYQFGNNEFRVPKKSRNFKEIQSVFSFNGIFKFEFAFILKFSFSLVFPSLICDNMNNINLLTRWKIQLNSGNSKIRIVALTEIVDMINSLSEDKLEDVYILFINSDICQFISQVISYWERTALSLINKIVCHLSEIEEFFKNDFYRILKGYSRIIPSLPSTFGDNKKQQMDVFTCINILVKR